MTDVTRILAAIGQGQSKASEDLLPLVYNELRRLAARQLRQKSTSDTFQATELVHEAFLRLVDVERLQSWDSRGHFFAAAAEAMRRILVERARRKSRIKHGGQLRRVAFLELPGDVAESPVDLLALDDALLGFSVEYPQQAQLVKLQVGS